MIPTQTVSVSFAPRPAMLAALLLSCIACGGATPVSATPVNINSADAATIARSLKGIGLKRAQGIVEHRLKHGPFKSADELGLVRGIGPKVIQANRADIRVDAGRPAAPAGTVTRQPAVGTLPSSPR